MANFVKLYRRSNGKFDLVVNSLSAKENFTATTPAQAILEAQEFLASTEGLARLSGIFVDLTFAGISYVNNSDSTSYQSEDIEFIDQM